LHYLLLLHTNALPFKTPSCLVHYASCLDSSTFEACGKLDVPPNKVLHLSLKQKSENFFLNNCLYFALILYMVPSVKKVLHSEKHLLSLWRASKYILSHFLTFRLIIISSTTSKSAFTILVDNYLLELTKFLVWNFVVAAICFPLIQNVARFVT